MALTALSPASEQKITIRAFSDSDYAQVAALYIQHDLEFIGSSNFSEQFLRDDWTMVNFDPQTDVAVAELADGTLVGTISCYAIRPVPSRPVLFGYAKPSYREAAAPALIEWGIGRARQVLTRVPEDVRVVLEASVHHADETWRAALEQVSFSTDHCTLTMLIEFDGTEIPAPALPDGLRFVSFADLPEIRLWAQAVKSSFADHRGSTDDMPLSYYIARYERDVAQSDFDASTWWMIMDCDTPAAICTTYEESDEFPNVAYVHQLGTVPAYRRRGLGLALLQHTFRDYQRRGRAGVSLGVDGSSLTNAVALYKRAGMRPAIQWDRYERELRPGVEITRQ